MGVLAGRHEGAFGIGSASVNKQWVRAAKTATAIAMMNRMDVVAIAKGTGPFCDWLSNKVQFRCPHENNPLLDSDKVPRALSKEPPKPKVPQGLKPKEPKGRQRAEGAKGPPKPKEPKPKEPKGRQSRRCIPSVSLLLVRLKLKRNLKCLEKCLA